MKLNLAIILGIAGLLVFFGIQRNELAEISGAQRDLKSKISVARRQIASAAMHPPAPAAANTDRTAPPPAPDLQRALVAAAVRRAVAPPDVVSAALIPSRKMRQVIGSDPALRALYQKAFVSSIDTLWQGFFAEHELTADQIQAFERAQWELEQVKLDASSVQGSSSASPNQIRQIWATADADMKSQLSTLLGKANYDAYKSYSQELPSRPIVNQLFGEMGQTQDPLSVAQADQLTDLISNNSKKTAAGWVVPNSVNWDTVLLNASTILSPTQLSALRAIHSQADAENAVIKELRKEIPAQ